MKTELLAAVALGAVLAGSPSPQQGSRRPVGPDLVINSVARFSTLDGSAFDSDGAADGILNLQSLAITDDGFLVLDVTRPAIVVAQDVLLEDKGRIGSDAGRARGAAPVLVITAGGSIRLIGNASIAVDGAQGGSAFLCAKTVDVLGLARVSANGFAGSAGGISISAQGRIVVGPEIVLSANGAYGGQITLRSCIAEKDAILLRGGKILASGAEHLGGQIRIDATVGGIEYEDRRSPQVMLEAAGRVAPGRVELNGPLGVAQILRTLSEPPATIGHAAQPLVTCTCPTFLPVLEVDPPASPTAATTITLSGRASAPGRQVRLEGPVDLEEVTAGGDRRFSATLQLAQNQINNIFVAEVDQGVPGPQLAVGVIQDVQGPTLFIDSPANNAQVSTATIDVAGRVGDMLSGSMGLTVTVNGVTALVDIGVGNNGTFLARNVPPLANGAIEAIATDTLQNTTSRSIAVTIQQPPSGMPRLVAVPGGNAQSARVNTQLAGPLEVRVLDGADMPIPGKLVTFGVTRSDGRLSSGAVGGNMVYQTFTDGAGVARAYWTLGSDAGCGNNRVEVTSTQVFGAIGFCASGLPAPARQINVGSGGNQIAEAGGSSPEPLRAWVSDGCNGVGGVPVTFRVARGGGTINGQLEATVVTGETGHAQVPFRLSATPGINFVEADFAGNSNAAATFVVNGIQRDPMQPTTFRGLVLDNGNNPIQGVVCTMDISGVQFGPETTDEDGQFLFDNLPIGGPGHLHVDGLQATHVGGLPIPPNTFPGLSYLVVVVPNATNSIAMGAVLLPRLNPNNERMYDADPPSMGGQVTTLEVEGVEGLRMVVTPGSMRINGLPAPDGTKIFLNQVNHDDVPMPMPDGVASPFAWTLQPSGATFDPPIQIIYPNMTGLPAGAIAYFLNFNHDTGRFEIIGSGHVSEDGAEIRSDQGVGISVAGWGCNCPPYSVTEDCKNCNVKVEGPEVTCIQSPMEYKATIRGDGILTWKVTDGTMVSMTSGTVSDGDVEMLDVTFMVPANAGGPLSSGSKVEAMLMCDATRSDEHGVGVTVIDVSFDPAQVVMRNVLSGASDKSILKIQDPATRDYELVNLLAPEIRDLDIEWDWFVGGEPDDDGMITAAPTDLAPYMQLVRVEAPDCEGEAASDLAYLVIVANEEQEAYTTWKNDNADLGWLATLPPPYSSHGFNMLGFATNPDTEGCTGWDFNTIFFASFHPGASREMRSLGGDGPEGHQATYDAMGILLNGSSLNRGLASGSADRHSPLDSIGQHGTIDVDPFLRAAHLDGNPVSQGLGLNGDLLRVSTELQAYFTRRPAFNPTANPQTLAPGECPPAE